MGIFSTAIVRLKRFAYQGLPRLTLILLRPIVRRSPVQEPEFLDRQDTPYEGAVHAMGEKHWDEKVRRLGLLSLPAVLDLGCGPGQWLDSLSRRNHFVIGMDIDARLLAFAQERTKSKPPLVRGEAERLPFVSEAFSAVLCYSVLMYTHEDFVLDEAFRIIKPGGRLFLGLIGSGYYLKHIVDGARNNRLEDVRYGLDPLFGSLARLIGRPAHVSWWTERRARKALACHGFEHIRSFADKKDPAWPERFLGSPLFFCVEARKRGDEAR